jgi:hypothetical protein
MKQSSRTNSFLEIVTTFWALILRLCAAYNNVFPTFITPHKFGSRILCARILRILLVVSHFNASFSLFDKPSCSSKPIIIIFATSVQFFIYKKLCDRMNGLYYVIWFMVSQYLQIDKIELFCMRTLTKSYEFSIVYWQLLFLSGSRKLFLVMLLLVILT